MRKDPEPKRQNRTEYSKQYCKAAVSGHQLEPSLSQKVSGQNSTQLKAPKKETNAQPNWEKII